MTIKQAIAALADRALDSVPGVTVIHGRLEGHRFAVAIAAGDHADGLVNAVQGLSGWTETQWMQIDGSEIALRTETGT